MRRTIESTFQDRKDRIRESYERMVSVRDQWILRNRYYYRELIRIIKVFIEPDGDIMQIGCGNGFLISHLSGCSRLGIDFSSGMINAARAKYPGIDFLVADAEDLPDLGRKFDYILLINIVGDLVDVQKAFAELRRFCHPGTRIIVVYYNYLWEPLVGLSELLGFKMGQSIQNWLSSGDIENLLYLEGFESVRKENYMLLPKNIPLISFLLNRIIGRLPLINKLCFVSVIVSRPLPPEKTDSEFSCSVIVPCKDEVGNIADLMARIPEMGRWTEIVFVDDRSTDGTASEVRRMMDAYPERKIVLVDGPGQGKFWAVKSGFDAAAGDVLMILDADATVMPEQLPAFFKAIIEGRGDFINGCRLVYEMEEGAMRLMNILGNKLFGLAFSYLLNQRIKDTLCGTKVFTRKNYLRMARYFDAFGNYDHWGDFRFIFSASMLNLKIIDLPVHYLERVEGKTKMKRRFTHGWLMLLMCWQAAKKIKFQFYKKS